MAKKDAWKEDGWERGDSTPGDGNQGRTYFARKSTDPPDQFQYILKILKRQNDPDRRAMFCGEIRAMDVLDHPGVIRVQATNAEHFRENVELYLVTERVDGSDLERFARERTLSLEEAVRLTVGVLHILDHCHKRGVIHRDIKPCHVILRGDSIDDPVLIDFGLAYHRETQPDDAATAPGQGKGNRFLTGPEHQTHDPDANRNTATDICQCLGLLFYAITLKYPAGLRDEHNRKPHERFSLDSLRPDIAAWKRHALLQILDIGFEWEVARRWQSIDRLVSQLTSLVGDQPPGDTALRLELAELMRRAKSDSATSKFQRARAMAAGLIEVVQSVVSTVSAETKEYLTIACGRPSEHAHTLVNLTISFQNKVDKIRSRTISFVVQWNGDTCIDTSLKPYTGSLRIFPNDQPVHLGTFELGYAECRFEVEDLLTAHLTKCVTEVLGLDEKPGTSAPVK